MAQPLSLHLPPVPENPDAAARSESYWRAVADLYETSDDVINFEHAYGGLLARPVLESFVSEIRRINREHPLYARTQAEEDLQRIRLRIAEALGVKVNEIALTQSATQAMASLICGYNKLRPGETVLYADLDYHAMQGAMEALARRCGAKVVKIALPEPATRRNCLEAYERALDQNPKAKVLLLTHISHRTGLLLPVEDIIGLARERAVDVLVDAAHAWGQIDFRLSASGADFVGLTLHKWIGAPNGVGALFIRESRIRDIDRDICSEELSQDDIQNRTRLGTPNMPAFLAAMTALDLHEAIGPARKAARLRYLRSLWAEELRKHPNVEVLTPNDPLAFAGITSFRIVGKTHYEENVEIAQTLLRDYGILTVARNGVSKGSCVRVTPSFCTTKNDIDALTSAIAAVAEGARPVPSNDKSVDDPMIVHIGCRRRKLDV